MTRRTWVELINGVSPAKIAIEYARVINIKLTESQLNKIMSTYISSSLLIEQCVNLIIFEIMEDKKLTIAR